MAKKPTAKRFYWIPTILAVLVVGISAAPVFVPGASAVYDPNILLILYGVLALAIALFTFGFLGDSEAFIRGKNPWGLHIQVGGSAAGFVIFFWLLSSGLNPYGTLTAHLLLDDLNGSRRPLGEAHGEISVIVASTIRHSVTTSDGVAMFPYLPRSEDWLLLVSGGWEIVNVEPSECWTDNRVSSSCGVVWASLRQPDLCISDTQAVVTNTEEWPLEVLLENLKTTMRSFAPRLSIVVRYTEAAAEGATHTKIVRMNDEDSSPSSGCDLLLEVQEQFNRQHVDNRIRLYATCNTIWVALSGEPNPATGELVCN